MVVPAPTLRTVSEDLWIAAYARLADSGARICSSGSGIARTAGANRKASYCGSAKTYIALLPLVVSASGVIPTPMAAIAPPPPAIAMY